MCNINSVPSSRKKNEKAKQGVKISLAYLENMDNKDPVTKVEPKGHI